MRNFMILSIASLLLVGCKADEKSGSEVHGPKEVTAAAKNQTGETNVPSVSDSIRAPQRNPQQVLPPSPAGAGYAPNDPEAVAAESLNARAKQEAETGVLSSTTQRHDQYVNEDRQDDWASFIEGKLRTHFLKVRFSNLDVVELGCKTSVCEIIALTRDSSSTSSALDAWQEEVYTLPREDWWKIAQMREPAFSVSTVDGGRAMFVTHLVRNTTHSKAE